MNKIQLNIDNLTSLWKTASQPFQTYFEQDNLAYCFIEDTEWPNRLWFKSTANENGMSSALSIAKQANVALTLSYFHSKDEGTNKITQNGFTEKSTQYGMSLLLDQPFAYHSQLVFERVKNSNDIHMWCDAFYQSFGYKISAATLEKTAHNIAYFIIKQEGQPAGTLILHITGKVAGIHSLGVVPSMRGKGIALEAMHFVLNKAIEEGANYATLQASPMAKHMYEKLGFTHDFIMSNYQLNKYAEHGITK